MQRKLLITTKDFQYLEILIIILISVAPYLSLMIKIALQLLIVILNIGRIRYISKHVYIMLILMACSALFDITNITHENIYSGNNWLYPLSMLTGALIATKYDLKGYLEKFEKVVYLLAILSLIGMSFYYIAPTLIERFPTYNFYGLRHRTIYFFNYIYAQGFLMVRNSGIAWEPGVFQILLNLGLAISLRRKDTKINYIRTFIYVISIVLTRSTIGLIILMVNLLVVIKRQRWFAILLIMALLVLSNEIYSMVTYQISNKWVGSVAFTNRINPTINAFLEGIRHPFGLGSTGYNAVYQIKKLGSFDSYTQILIRYGYALLTFFVYILYRIIKKDWLIGVIIALSLLTESMWNSVMLGVIYFLYLAELHDNINVAKRQTTID